MTFKDPTPTDTARQLKEVLTPDDLERLNPFHSIAENLCGVLPINEGRELLANRVEPAAVRIALVSMPGLRVEPQQFSTLPKNAVADDIDKGACLRQLVAYPHAVARDVFATFEAALSSALSLSPHVICFSELALPSVDGVPMQEAKRLVFEASRERDVVIIAGSAHDARTLYNTGYLFYPGGPENGRPFHKSVSAWSMRELISAPAARRILLAKVAGLRVATMICLDIADYASIASVVKVGDGIDVLLVPCYTTLFEKMDRVAIVASRALPGIVGMVNAVIPDVAAKPRQVAWFGKLRDPDDQSAAGGVQVSVIDIAYEEFQKSRSEMRSKSENKMRWLFGRRDMPTLLDDPAVT